MHASYAAHIEGQVLTSEGQTCSLGRTFTNGIGIELPTLQRILARAGWVILGLLVVLFLAWRVLKRRKRRQRRRSQRQGTRAVAAHAADKTQAMNNGCDEH